MDISSDKLMWQHTTWVCSHGMKIFGRIIVWYLVAFAFSANWNAYPGRYQKQRTKRKHKILNKYFWRGRKSCDLSHRNPLTKKFSAYLHVCLSLFSILWYSNPFCICVFFSAYLCLSGLSDLCSDRIPSMSRSKLTSSPSIVRVSSLLLSQQTHSPARELSYFQTFGYPNWTLKKPDNESPGYFE